MQRQDQLCRLKSDFFSSLNNNNCGDKTALGAELLTNLQQQNVASQPDLFFVVVFFSLFFFSVCKGEFVSTVQIFLSFVCNLEKTFVSMQSMLGQ